VGRAPTGKVTIKEVAAMCGVSTQTVSRVLNRRPDVSPETRALVETTVARIGYRPSALARSLVQQRSQTLGFVTTSLGYHGILETLNGVVDACDRADYALLVKGLHEPAQDELHDVIDFFIEHRVEGIVVLVPGLDVPRFLVERPLSTQTPPTVFVKSYPDPRYFNIAVDNVGGARTATEHLLGLGRRSVAHLSGPTWWSEARQRIEGWRAALVGAGMPPPPEALVHGDWTSQSGAVQMEVLLDQYPAMDAIFVGNDQMALGAMAVCHRRGISIPDDIAIVGFDGIEESAEYTPSLSTMVQPLRQMGEIAISELLAQAADATRSSSGSVVLDVELLARESTLGVTATAATG
jgi:LacI family transcriptional regulator